MSCFDISDLRFLLVHHLEIPTLKACTTVCKTWHADIQPWLWKRIAINVDRFHLANPEEVETRLASIRKNARHAKHLLLTYISHRTNPSPLYEVLVENCRSLVTVNAGVIDSNSLALFTKLLESNSDLEQVSVYVPITNETLMRSLELRHTFAALPRLHSLSLDARLPGRDLLLFLEACPQLPNFTVFTQYWGEYMRVEIAPGTAIRLKSLHVCGRIKSAGLATLLDHCSALESLRLTFLNEFACQSLCNALRDRLPRLTSLHLLSVAIDTRLVFSIMCALPIGQLREVELVEPALQVFQTLISRQRQSLEAIQLFIRPGQENMLMDLFAACMRLKCITIHSFKDVDIRWLLGRPWACTDLMRLVVPFGLVHDCKDQALLSIAATEKAKEAPGQLEWVQAEILFMKRLGHLTQLRELSLEEGYHATPNSLMWLLRTKGLPYLSGLSQLEVLDFSNHNCPFGISELQYLKEHWPRLNRFRCLSVADPQVKQWLGEHWPHVNVFEWNIVLARRRQKDG